MRESTQIDRLSQVETRGCLSFVAAALMFVSFLLLLTPAQAMSGRWADNDQASVRLISAVDTVGTVEKLQFGMEFHLQPGWKIYWRSPGDAGLPPVPDWSRSENVAAVGMDWPLPIRFELFGLQTFGYEEKVVFPLSVQPETPGKPVSLNGTVSYLVCKEICIPHQADISLDIPEGPGQSSAKTHTIGQYMAKVPRRPASTGLRVDSSAIQAQDENSVVLQVAVLDDQPLGVLEILVEGPDGSFFDAPLVSYNGDRTSAILTVSGGGATPEQVASAGATVTIAEDKQAIETTITPVIGVLAEPGSTDSANGSTSSFFVPLSIFGLALLGGLILNLMPCVLPVLSLKLLSLIKHGGGDRRAVRIGFLASSAGILSFFLILGGGSRQFEAGWINNRMGNPVSATGLSGLYDCDPDACLPPICSVFLSSCSPASLQIMQQRPVLEAGSAGIF